MKHTLSVLVEDESGALSRIAGLFARRGFNIDSLAVGPAEADGRSRLLKLQPSKPITSPGFNSSDTSATKGRPPNVRATRSRVRLMASGELG